MDSKRSLNFVEMHVEKIVLGAAVAFTLGVGVYVLLGPNQVEYQGQNLGPRDLNRVILGRAQNMRHAFDRATPSVAPLPDYARMLEARFEQPIFASDLLPPALVSPALFNRELPQITEGPGEITKTDVVLVTPLRPTGLAVRAGRSIVFRPPERATIATGGRLPSSRPSEKPERPVEVFWASPAGWFDVKAQRADMTSAGYAPHRAHVYFVGTDVQRQERLPSGDFGPWEDVVPGRAMPRVDIPAPVIDKQTGEVLNQGQLDEALDVVKVNQIEIIEPEFYTYQAGGVWTVPPLPGPEAAEEPEELDDGSGETTQGPPDPPPGSNPGQVITGPQPPRPDGGPGNRPGQEDSRERSAAAQRRQIEKDLTDARTALRKGDYVRAEQLAQPVLSNPRAAGEQMARARHILQQIAEARIRILTTQRARNDDTWSVRLPVRPVTHPKTGAVAVWFHDDSVEPGKTYRYRMRVKLWNRYVGRLASLANPEQAQQTVLIGEWSLPGDPITIAPKLHFFVRSQKWNEPAAQVDVFAWHKGKWLREPFDVRVGEVIGAVKEIKVGEDEDGKALRESVDFTTHAIVMDIRPEEPVLTRTSAGKAGEFRYSEGRSLVLTYLDPADGQIKERSLNGDKANPLYEKLKRRAQGVPRRVP